MSVQLNRRINILRPREGVARLDQPVTVEGRTFTHERRAIHLPFHRKQAAAVEDVPGGKTITLRQLRGLDVSMRVEIDGKHYAIEKIEDLQQGGSDVDGKPKGYLYTRLTCREASDGI
jgi:hypothetical protein